MWYVYILECSDRTLYTGVTTDLRRRVAEHNSGDKGAKYTRARQPVQLVYSKTFRSRSRAQQEEALIKGLSREQKHALIAGA